MGGCAGVSEWVMEWARGWVGRGRGVGDRRVSVHGGRGARCVGSVECGVGRGGPRCRCGCGCFA